MNERDILDIAEALRCPIRWHEVCPNEEFTLELDFMWFSTVHEFQVDGETSLFSYEDWQPDASQIESMHDEVDLRARLENATVWRPRAIRKYMTEFSRFEQLRVAASDDYEKHFAPMDAGVDEVAKQSRTSGDGIWYPQFDIHWQRRLAYAAISEEWRASGIGGLSLDDHGNPMPRADAFRQMFGVSNMSILFEFPDPIGCAKGEPTCHGLFKFSFVRPNLMHGYPCKKTDYHRLHKVVHVPRWVVAE
jgi:hypothetical protein